MEVCHTVQKMFSASETFKFLILKLKKLPKRIKIAPNETGITIRSNIHKKERLITRF